MANPEQKSCTYEICTHPEGQCFLQMQVQSQGSIGKKEDVDPAILWKKEVWDAFTQRIVLTAQAHNCQDLEQLKKLIEGTTPVFRP